MSRRVLTFWAALVSMAVGLSGCQPTQPFYMSENGDLSHYVDVATNIEYPDAQTCMLADVEGACAPLTLDNTDSLQMWDLCLQEAVQAALTNSKVIRSLGGRYASSAFNPRAQVGEAPDAIISSADQSKTVYDPAITETTPFTGVEYALAAFDAQLSSSLTWQKNDHYQNFSTPIFSKAFQQDTGVFNAQISKVTAAGGTFTVRHNVNYDQNNNGSRQIPSDWNVNFEMSFSQPLLQGSGVQFNRIAGPVNPFTGVGTPQFDGVLLARINTDISLADFEIGVRNLVRDVEDAYWELYFAYRNLEASKTGRASALQTWKKVHALYVVGGLGGEAEKEAQARQQYFIFRGQVQTAYNDLLRAENRVRYIMGISVSDGRLIRPKDEPTTARVNFDWHEIHEEGLCRSVELRRQKWRLKERELELIAARNLLQPRLDASGTYRWLGIGDQMLGRGEGFIDTDPNNNNALRDTNAYQVLGNGQFQEWQFGFNFTMPLGFRKELSTIRHYQLQLTRERARLQDEELEISHELGDAVRNLDYNYELTLSNLNRRIAAEREVDAVQAAYNAGKVTFDLLLNAQQRQSDAEIAYYRSLADYNRAIIQIHYRKGSLLEYNGVYLTEGPWPAKAQFDAHRLAQERGASYYLNYGYTRPRVISQGPYQQLSDHGGSADGLMPVEPGAPHEAPPEEVPAPTPSRTSNPRYNNPTRQTAPQQYEPALGRQNGPVLNQPRLRTAGQQQGESFAWGSLGLDSPAEVSPKTADKRTARIDESQRRETQPLTERTAKTESRLTTRNLVRVSERSPAAADQSDAGLSQESSRAQLDDAQRKPIDTGTTRAIHDEWKATSYEPVADPSSGSTDWVSSGWKGSKR